jgi:hypothetical protein
MTQTQQPGRRRFRWYGGGRKGWPLVKYGMIWFGIGVVITVATYAFAVNRGGGTYLVSYGPMIVGVVSMVRGGIDMARERRAGGSAPGEAPVPAFAQSPGNEMRAMPDGGMPGGGPRPGARSVAAPAPGAGYSGRPAREPAYGAATREPAYGAQGNESWQGSRNGPRQGGPRQGGPGYGPIGAAGAVSPEPNWYPDPQNPAILRWWDGQIWTNHTRPYN